MKDSAEQILRSEFLKDFPEEEVAEIFEDEPDKINIILRAMEAYSRNDLIKELSEALSFTIGYLEPLNAKTYQDNAISEQLPAAKEVLEKAKLLMGR